MTSPKSDQIRALREIRFEELIVKPRKIVDEGYDLAREGPASEEQIINRSTREESKCLKR